LRRLAPFLLAIVILLLPAVAPAASAAGAELTYQTPNGQRTLVQMGDELMSVGYGGPWDTQSVINAYAQTTGGQVQVIGVITGQAGPPPPLGPSPSSTPMSNSAARRTIIVEIGGANSSPGGWLALESTLRVEGYTSADFYPFSYGGWSVAQGSSTMILNDYTSAQTCGKIDDSIRVLAGMLRFLRDNQWAAHVVLVGHSVGGIVALGVVSENPDLAGFVREVIPVDAPLGGLSSSRVGFNDFWNGSCTAVDQLTAPGWATWSANGAAAIMAQGISIMDVVNGFDNAVPAAAQQLPQSVNYRFDVSAGSGLINHNAVLSDPRALSAIAQFIGPQSQ
jgi:pimeloyl-ACP methyl ester carboxylesterase